MVCANLQSLISPHNQPRLPIFLVFQQPNIARTTLLPLIRLSNKLEQLSAHLENLLFHFLVRLGLDFLSEADNGLEMDVFRLGGFILCQDRQLLSIFGKGDE